VLLTFSPALAQETITYTYDNKGRLQTANHGSTGPAAGASATYNYDNADNRTTVTINGTTVTVSPASLPNGTVGSGYSQTISASGGFPGYTYQTTSGGLPTGLSLNGSTGLLSGTPSAGGTSSFTVTATDSSGNTGSRAYSLAINGAVTLSPAALPNGTVGAAYSQTVSASGGTGTGYSYSVSSGALPAGLSLNASTGLVSGTPTTATSYSFTIRAVDSGSNAGSQAYNVTIGTAGPTVINLTSGAGVNLRTIANNNGYTGSSSANYQFVVGSGVTITGSAGSGTGVDTGTWPAGVTLSLNVNSSGTVRGGGGIGGNGGGWNGSSTTNPTSGGAGGAGGAAGYAVRKNGTGCTLTNNGGTVTGTVG
jgi:hypothetical protein